MLESGPRIPNSRFLIPIPSALGLVFVGAELVLGAGHWIVRQPVVIHAVAVRIPELLIERCVAFNGAFVNVGIPLLLDRDEAHVPLPGEPPRLATAGG
jgi:hypothetical protein